MNDEQKAFLRSLGIDLEPRPDPWQAWLARPHSRWTRLHDLMLQIKRDHKALRSGLLGRETKAFVEERLAAYRAEAQVLAAQEKR